MEHNKNGILALIVLFVGLAFLLSVWFIIYGAPFKSKKFYLLDMKMKKNFLYEKNSYEF